MRKWTGLGGAALAVAVAAATAYMSQAEEAVSKSARSLSLPFAAMKWRKQSPDVPIQLSELWGNREQDGGFGELVQLPPGFDSGLHAHSGDFHGVLIRGTWVHVNEQGQGAEMPLAPGSYVRQAGGRMHVDRCVSKEPCILFLFQYARADVIWPDKR